MTSVRRRWRFKMNRQTKSRSPASLNQETVMEILQPQPVKNRTKFVRAGKYVAEVDVELLETDDELAPYLSVDDAYKLDDVREALRRGDLKAAARLGRVFTLTPVDA